MMSLRTVALALAALASSQAHAGPLQTAPVERTTGAAAYVAEGVVEALRETALAVEVQGRITDIRVQAGDRVKAGQVLARIDARLAGQQAAARWPTRRRRVWRRRKRSTIAADSWPKNITSARPRASAPRRSFARARPRPGPASQRQRRRVWAGRCARWW